MGREHKAAAAVASAAGRPPAAVQKHKKRTRRDHDHILPAGLIARPAVPRSKHKTIYEWTENTNKKKKLEIEVTNHRKPSANFTFVPIGNPELTSLCKELSREQGALVYIVSGTKEKLADLSDHVHRIGFHFRTHIVEQAATIVGGIGSVQLNESDLSQDHRRKPDRIPEDQGEINRQADAAIRDLFPRIPNTDREMIVRHAFQKGAVFNGKPVVGLQEDLTLSRRVQLAVIAHIRHTHTRYDLLLKETSWENARKAVESLCLDILVKWRGDEETGRDQLDEVLREIVVIDDSDDESGSEESEDNGNAVDEEDDEASIEEIILDSNKEGTVGISQPRPASRPCRITRAQKRQKKRAIRISNGEQSVSTCSRIRPKEQSVTKNERRGFQRYKAWQEALNRQQNQRLDYPHEEPASTNNIQQITRLPDTMNGISSNYLSSSLHPAYRDQQYQSIYAIDNYAYNQPRVSAAIVSNAGYSIADRFVNSTEPGQQPPPPPPQRMVSLQEPSYGEQVIMRPRINNPPVLEHSYGSDSRPIPMKSMQIDRPAPEDRVIPSIEQPGDLDCEALPVNNIHGPVRFSQVRHVDNEPQSRLVQNSSNIIYIDDLENQNKRRRILAEDSAHFPGGDHYARIAPTAAPASHYLFEQPLRRIINTVDRNDLSTFDNRSKEGLVTTTKRDLVIDDELQFIKVVERSPRHNSFSREQHLNEPQTYKRHIAANQPYLGTERSALMRAPDHKDERRSEINQAYLSLPQDRRHATDNFTYFSLPSHPHSREMNTGSVSYPIISRTRLQNDSRFPSAWNEPIMPRTELSHHPPKELLKAENHDVNVFRPEEYRRPAEPQKVFQIEQRYNPPVSYDRGTEFVSASRRAAGPGAPVCLKNIPRREEIIVIE